MQIRWILDGSSVASLRRRCGRWMASLANACMQCLMHKHEAWFGFLEKLKDLPQIEKLSAIRVKQWLLSQDAASERWESKECTSLQEVLEEEHIEQACQRAALPEACACVEFCRLTYFGYMSWGANSMLSGLQRSSCVLERQRGGQWQHST